MTTAESRRWYVDYVLGKSMRRGVHQGESRKRMMRVRDTAHYLSLSPWTVRDMAHRGELRFVQATEQSPMLFDIQDLDRWIEQSKH
jgi:excisionase family DNA binding protein